jgi:hypothetical protein
MAGWLDARSVPFEERAAAVRLRGEAEQAATRARRTPELLDRGLEHVLQACGEADPLRDVQGRRVAHTLAGELDLSAARFAGQGRENRTRHPEAEQLHDDRQRVRAHEDRSDRRSRRADEDRVGGGFDRAKEEG